jgi:spermidine dehydrogenase
MGVTAGMSALVSARAQNAIAEDDPPLRAGLRGNYPAALAEFDLIRQGQYAQSPVSDTDIQEEYDLVIVGGGISGLSAAYLYRAALGAGPKILILNNHDDFGGHAKRNEFHYQGKTFIGFGGTMGIETPYPYSYGAKALIRDLGVEVERNPQFINRDLEQKYGLAAGTFFDKEHFGEDRLVKGNPRRPQFFAKAPLSDAARKDLIRLHGKNPDYMAGMSTHDKRATLAKMSYQDYLLNFAKMSPDALPFFMGSGGRNNKRVDTTPALEAAEHGLVGKLIPAALPGKQSMDTIVAARLTYDKLDDPNSNTRIRLSSPVVRVEHEGMPDRSQRVSIAYRHGDKTCGVRTRYCILACNNALIPALMPDIPAHQKEALAYPVKVPMMYTIC